MNKKALILGLAGSMLINTFMPINVFANDVDEVKHESIVEKEIISLSLEDAIKYALEHSKDIEIQRLELLKAEIAYEEGIKNVKNAEKNIDFIFESEIATPDVAVNKELIKNGASRRSVLLAYNVAKWNIQLKENQIKYNVEKAYFDLLQIKKEFLIAKESLELSQKQYEHAKRRFELGMLSKQQLLGIELGLSQAQSIYDTAKMMYDLQMMGFQNTVGLPFDKEVELTDNFEIKEYEKIDLAESIKLGLENNLVMKVAQETFEIAKLSLNATSVRYPDITFRYREKAVEVERAARHLEIARNSLIMGVKSAYLNLETAEKQIKTLEKAVEQAEQALKIAETTFELGQSTSVDVTQANINLMNAKKNLSQQIHAYNLALLDYEYSIGIGKGTI